MVNLEWYRTFKAIYQNGTLTKAAEELLISQPNVSIQLSSLETYIGHPLFIRLPRKMEPTEYGKRLYTQIVESIDNLERIESEFKKNNLNKAPTVRLGTPPELFLNYMAPNVHKLQSTIDIKYGMAETLTEMLLSNELNIAVITKQDKSSTILTYEPLITETFMITCSYDFNTEEFDNIIKEEDIDGAEKWLKDRDWYAYGNNLVLIRRFWRENFKKRPVLKLKAVIPDNNALLEAVSSSDTLTVSSDLISHNKLREGKVKVLWKGIYPATNTLYLAYNKAKISAEQIREIKDLLDISLPPLG